MSNENPFAGLIALSGVDRKEAILHSELRKLETECKTVKDLAHVADRKLQESTEALKRRQAAQSTEEAHIKEERQKLVQRRKAMGTFADYKTQQVADREIEATSRKLDVQEESLIAEIDRIDKLNRERTELISKREQAVATWENLKGTVQTRYSEIQEQLKEIQTERQKLVELINPAYMQIYQRAHEKYPADAVVPVSGGGCSGCFMKLGAQTLVNIEKASNLVRCDACGRILYHVDR